MRGSMWAAVVLLVAGCSSAPHADIQEVAGEQPSLRFSWEPTEPVVGEQVRFVPSARVRAGTDVVSWHWDFGDGATSRAPAPRHMFEHEDVHVVRVTLEVDDGTRLAYSDQVVVGAAQGPSANGPEPSTPTPETDNATQGPETYPPAALPPDSDPGIVKLRAAILAGVAAGRPVTVPAYAVQAFTSASLDETPREWNVLLQRSPILDGNVSWLVEGSPVPPPFVELYEGHVHGDEEALVRLTLTGYWVRGSIRSGDAEHLIRINFVDNKPQSSAERAILPDFATAGAPPAPPPISYDGARTEPGRCPGGTESYAPSHAEPLLGDGRATLPPRWARIVLDGDAQLARRLGSDAMPMLVAMLAEAESIYDHEVAVRHTVVAVHLHEEDRFAPPDDASPLPTLANYWADRYLDRDMVHLVTGHDSTFAMANCIGGAGDPQAAYTFTPWPWEEKYTVFATHAYAHELGHIYSAHHHYGNHAESTLATIMIQGYTPGDLPVFSTVSKAVVRGWAQDHLD